MMFRSYLKAAMRNIRRESAYALINVFGLAIGLAICLLVIAYVVDEQSFDRFHRKAERIYRVNKDVSNDSERRFEANTSFLLRPLIQEQIPDVESVVQVIPENQSVVRAGEKSFTVLMTMADAGFFEMFSFPMVGGDRPAVLENPSSVVISSSLATKLYGERNPVGEVISISWAGKANQFTVAAVAQDPPTNSSLGFEMVISLAAMDRYFKSTPGWNTSWPDTYVLLRPQASQSRVQAAIDRACKSIPKLPGSGAEQKYQLQPMTDIHLNTNVMSSSKTSSPLYSYLLGMVGLVVLGLACINFTTLAIGRAQRRVREIGVRKMIGATRNQVITQILGETVLSATISMILALVLAELFLPRFGNLSGKQFHTIIDAVGFWLMPACGLVLLTALFAGGYPALVLSRIRMIDSVRGKAALLTSRTLTRVLVVLQFGISAALIAVTLSMSHQLQYMLNAPLGFDKEQLVMIRLDGSGNERINTVERLRQSTDGSSGILSVSAMSDDMAGGGMRMGNRVGPDSSVVEIFMNPVDREYLKTMNIDLVAGHDFTASAKAGGITDVIINQALVRAMEWDNPIGKEAPMLKQTRIIGVARDFHHQPFTTEIEPMALIATSPGDDWSESLAYALVRLAPGDLTGAMSELEAAWKKVAAQVPFDYEFLDARLDAQYRTYQRWASIMGDAAILAVVVACFGVFGLTALAVTRRRKEIGIRKVLGASGRQLVGMFYREFIILAAIGNLIGWPVAYYSVNRWMSEFVYRAAMSPWPFVAGLVMLIVVVLLTVSMQAIRATSANPASVIRYE